MTLLRCLAPFVLAGCAACTPANVELTDATTPACTAEGNGQWDKVTNQMQGVNGFDPVGHYVAGFPAEKFGPLNINNWRPLSGYKEPLCGQLHRFNVYDGSGAEMDWNNFIIPSADFQFLITDALPYQGGGGAYCVEDSWQSCVSGSDCLEAEITPDESFYVNPWFPKATGTSVLEGQPVCTYGPWIRECVHGHRPEIHTSEQMWWREKFGNGTLHWLMAIQDDSNRFDDEDEFDIEGNKPPGWRPWAAAPVSANFALSFEVDPAKTALDLQIGESFARNVVTASDAAARSDADNGVEHGISYNGKLVLRVTETQPKDDDLGVTFTDVCRQPNGRLRGYVTVATKVGVNNDGREGYHVLFVHSGQQGDVRPNPTPPEKADTLVLMKGVAGSLRSAEESGRRRLLGDLQFDPAPTSSSSGQERKILRIEELSSAASRQLALEAAPSGGNAIIVKGLPIREALRLRVHLSDGAPVELAWPGLAIAGLMDDEVQSASNASPGAWRNLVSAAGGGQLAQPQALVTKRSDRARLRVVPQYATTKDGRVSLEEDSPFSERLNEALARRDPAALETLFGRGQPITIAWSFTATDVATRKAVPVALGNSAAAGRNIVITSERAGQPNNDVVEIAFPDAGDAIVQVDATATLTDAFGGTSRVTRRLWSHYITDTTVDGILSALLPAVAVAAGVNADQLLAAGRLGVLPPNDPRRSDATIRRSLIVHNAARQAAEDSRITVEELGSLIRGARLLR